MSLVGGIWIFSKAKTTRTVLSVSQVPLLESTCPQWPLPRSMQTYRWVPSQIRHKSDTKLRLTVNCTITNLLWLTFKLTTGVIYGWSDLIDISSRLPNLEPIAPQFSQFERNWFSFVEPNQSRLDLELITTGRLSCVDGAVGRLTQSNESKAEYPELTTYH